MSANPGSNAPTQYTPQGPNAYVSGGAGGPQQPAGAGGRPPLKQRFTLAIAALVTAILGFVFAVWEGAYIVGWVLLPVAFILSLVALFQRDRPKKMAAAALAVTVVGTIAGAVAFVSSLASAVDEAFDEELDVVATATAPAGQSPAAESESPTVEPAGAAGTRADPHPLGTTVSSSDWEVTVNSFTPDATAAVLAENPFSEEPAPGMVYALINVTLTYLGEESGISPEVGVDFVTSTGEVVDATDTLAVAPDELLLDELYAGGSVTGNVVRQIPAGDAGTIRITPGLFADEAFFALQ